MYEQNRTNAYQAIDAVGPNALDCARHLTERGVTARQAEFFDTTQQTEQFGVMLDGSWLVVG